MFGWYAIVEDGLIAGRGCVEVDGVDVVIGLDCSCRVRASGAEYACFDIVDFDVAPWENLVGAILRLLSERRRGRRVYVHCRAGCGRTGTVVSAYLILSRGMSPREAVGYFRRVRGCGPESWQQHVFLEALGRLVVERGVEGALRALREASSFEEFLGMAGLLRG